MNFNKLPNGSGKRVAHLTSVHPRTDIRILIKQCRSLSTNGYDVTLVVADGQGDETEEKVKIVDVGHRSGRFIRVVKTTRRVLKKAIELNADLYHFHDPELIPVGLRLKRLGKKVVFDSHEDVPKQLLGKPYLSPLILRILSTIFVIYERYTCPRFDAIIAATPFIRDKFSKMNHLSVDINNFPLIGELDSNTLWPDKQYEVCYVGGIGPTRGIREMIRTCELLQTPTRLNLVGHLPKSELRSEIESCKGWERVNDFGFLDRNGVRNVLARSMAGVVILHPLTNYLDSLPIKMFEYMAAGIPVIASNFPLWREIIETHDCGLCVDPLDPYAIAEAIDFLIANPKRARMMGENGRRAVQNQYNWSFEERKMLHLYQKILR